MPPTLCDRPERNQLAAKLLARAQRVANSLFPCDPDSADEVAQESTLRVLRDVERKSLVVGPDLEGVSVRLACRSVASHYVRAKANRAKHTREMPAHYHHPADTQADPGEEAERREEAERVRAALATLPATDAAFAMRHWGRGEFVSSLAAAGFNCGGRMRVRLRRRVQAALLATDHEWLREVLECVAGVLAAAGE